MKTIYKYPVPIDDDFELDLPVGARLLCVDTQRGVPNLWALVDMDPGLGSETRRFRLAGTGHPLDDRPLDYVGTFQLHRGSLVFHLFEKKS
jgi:hypothetical protein